MLVGLSNLVRRSPKGVQALMRTSGRLGAHHRGRRRCRLPLHAGLPVDAYLSSGGYTFARRLAGCCVFGLWGTLFCTPACRLLRLEFRGLFVATALDLGLCRHKGAMGKH